MLVTLLAAAAATFAVALPSGVAHADPVSDVALQSLTEGTAPFDALPGPGSDTGATNGEVRSYDSVTFAWAVNVNSSSGMSESFDRVVFEQTLPAGLSWQSATVPVYCKGAGWGVAGQTLTCVYVPPGGNGTTGTTLNFSLTAMADGVIDGTVATPAADSTSVTVHEGATSSAPATATAPPVTIRSAPWVDMYKENAVGSIAPGGNPLGAGYYVTYEVGIKVPPARQSSHGRRGFLMPSAPVTFTDDLSGVSAGAQFVSCSGPLVCNATGQSVAVSLSTLPAAPQTNGDIAEGTLRVFVPQADVDADADGNLLTTNVLTTLVADAPVDGGGTVASQGDQLANNTVSYNLITQGGSGNAGFNKRFLAADGNLLPTQATANDGNGQVRHGQTILSELRVGNNSQTAPVPAPAMCDVWDNTRVHLSNAGPGPMANGGRAVWQQSGGLTEGVDYVIEYGTQATATGDDGTRWTELRNRSACSDASDTWTTTPPSDLTTVTKVRVRLLADLPPAAGTKVFRVNLVIDDPADGDTVANFLGTRVGTTWSASTYNPTTNAGNQRGDRVRTNGVTVRIRKRSINPSVSFGSPAAILSGSAIRFELTPTVTALDIGAGAPSATNVVVRDRLPAGLTFDATQPTTGGIEPVVSSDGSGRQILTWTIPTLTKGSEPVLTFWAQSASTAIGTRVNEVILDSDSDVGGLDTFPGSTSTTDQHYSTQTVQLQSPGGVRISKAALQTVVEPHDEIAYRIEYANLTVNPVGNVDIIDVLPFAGDGTTVGALPGRVPASARAGTLGVRAIEVAAGETVRYTDAPAADVHASSSPATTVDANYGALPAGRSWCVEADFGTAGCPDDLDDVTAVRVARAALPSGASGQITVRLDPRGNRSGDVYSNTAAIRYGTGNLGALSNVATTRVVASAVGDYVWEDADQDGIQDADEKPLEGVKVTLTGTDKHGRAISVETTTDADGLYRFTSSTQAGQDADVLDLVSGSYTVTFHRDGLPAGTTFTGRNLPGSTAADGSDADPATGQAPVTVPDPAPSGVDGEDLTIDAGIVLGKPVPPTDPEEEPKPEPEPEPKPPVTTPTPPTPPAPPAPPAPKPVPPAKVQPKGKPSPPKLTVTQRAAKRRVVSGRSVTFTYTVKNSGGAPAKKTELCVAPGKGMSVGKVPEGAEFRDGRLCLEVGTLPAGATRTLRVTMRTARSVRASSASPVASVSASGVRARRAPAARVRTAPSPAAVRGVQGRSGVTG